MTSRRRKASNQYWIIVFYVDFECYNVEQRRINIVYFSAYINNVGQCRNNVIIFNVEVHDFD